MANGPTSDRRARRRWPYLVGVAVLAVLGVGVAIALSNAVEGGSEDRAIGLVPEDAAAYATIYLNPSVSQKLAVKHVVERVGRGEEESGRSLDDAIGALVEAISPVDYESDLKPELGDQIAAYDRPGEAATLLAATDDPRASRLAMHRLLEGEYYGSGYRITVDSYDGQPYEHVVMPGADPTAGTSAFTIVDGFVVLGSDEAVRDSIAARHGGDSLRDAEGFAEAGGGASGDSVAFAYVDPAAFVAEPREDEYRAPGEIISMDLLRGIGPVAATLTAGDESAALEFSTKRGSSDAAPFEDAAALLRTLPDDAVAAVSLGDLEGPLRAWLDGAPSSLTEEARDAVAKVGGLDLDRDVASWPGGVAAYVSGSSEETAEAAVVAETRSPADSAAMVSRIGDYYEGRYYEDEYSEHPVYSSADGQGFDVGLGEDSLAVRGDEERVVAAVGPGDLAAERALEPEGGFGDSELYGRATDLLGGGYEPFLAVDAPTARSLIEQFTGAGGPSYSEPVEDWLGELETVAAGARADGDRLRTKLAVGFR